MGMHPGSVGYKSPPTSTQFKKGQSGNPKGRPRNRKSKIPYDTVLGRMVTIREDGRERRITAAEAFLLHLTKKGLEGDSASARASLAAIEAARATPAHAQPAVQHIVIHYVEPGSVGTGLRALKMAVKQNKRSEHARNLLRPWIVEAALARLGDRQLSLEEQQVVFNVTQTPEKVSWPEWWSLRHSASGSAH